MRFFHGGALAMDPERVAEERAVDDEDKVKIKADIAKHHKLGKPGRDSLEMVDGQVMLKVPPMFWRTEMVRVGDQMVSIADKRSQYTSWEPGSITLSLPGVGFWVIPPGGFCDVPNEVSTKTIKESAPHLLTEAEAILLNVAEPAPVPVSTKPNKGIK